MTGASSIGSPHGTRYALDDPVPLFADALG